MYKVILTKQALKDLHKLKSIGLAKKAEVIKNLIKLDPFVYPPPFEKLVGNLYGFYSRRINAKHRFIYKVNLETKIVTVIGMWSHYENVH